MVSEIRFCICQPVNLKGNKPWILIGRTDAEAEAEAPVFWSPNANSWLIGKVSDAGKDWGQKEKRVSGWDGWMASLMQWTWTWANFRRWRGTGRPGVLQSMGLQRVGYDWVTEQQHMSLYLFLKNLFISNWRVIALQYCVGFYQTSTWISHSLYMS